MTTDKIKKALAENYTRTWREQFHLQKKEPLLWGDKAFELFHASDVLNAAYQQAQARHNADPMNYYKPFGSMVPIYELRLLKLVYYLRGLAVENLLKGILVAKEIKIERTHDLRRLATKAALPLSKRQFLLLDELAGAVTWHGRYHVPLHVEEMTPRAGLRDFPSIPGELDEREQTEVIALIKQLIETYKKQIEIFAPIRESRVAAQRSKKR